MLDKLKLFSQLELDEEKGEMRVGGCRVFLPPTKVISATRRKLVRIGPAAKRFMYEAGKEAGEEFASSFVEVLGIIDNEKDFVKMSENFGVMTGWGKISVVEKDWENKRFKIEIENYFIESDKKEKTGEYPAGMLAGAAEYILEREMDVKEIRCMNEGFDKCTFEMRPSEEFESLF